MEAKEILFRGRRLDNKKWVYGCHTRGDHGRSFITIWNEYSYEVDPKTDGQWSGLYDSGSKFHEDGLVHSEKIFSGDILACKQTQKLYEVVFEYGCFLVKNIWSKKEVSYPLQVFLSMYGHNLDSVLVVDTVSEFNEQLQAKDDEEYYTDYGFFKKGIMFATIDEAFDYFKE